MCGLAGVFAFHRAGAVLPDLVRAMREALAHRGPDGAGELLGPGFGLGHRRLAIIDVQGGAQPMTDREGTVAVVCNGEIYNYRELTARLEEAGHRFLTRSDSEVLVHGWKEWGTAMLGRLVGMFAFAVVDMAGHRLFLARDRLGKKPLYYRRDGERILFASEVKALLADPEAPRRVRPEALAEYLALRYVPSPGTMLEGIQKLPPAHWLLAEEGGRVAVGRWWDLSFASPLRKDPRVWREEILGTLDGAVRDRMVSERPLGAFLSGGVDSTAVVASMARAGGGPVKACVVGFQDRGLDERRFARDAARFLGAELAEEMVALDPEADLHRIAGQFDDPLGDSSALPTWHVSRMARRHVTVALSGDGGDENFAGYRRHRFDLWENRARSALPGWFRRGPCRWLARLLPAGAFLPRWLRWRRTLLNLGLSPEEAYFRSVSCATPEEVEALLAPEARGADPFAALRAHYRRADGRDPLSRVLYTDFMTWLPEDILAKVDRTSMAVALEVRCPLLDHRFVELCARIPASEKVGWTGGKAIFRRALRGRVPDAVLDRRKQGFEIPAARWLRGELAGALRDLAGGELAARHLRPARVAGLVEEHLSGRRDRSQVLWSLLVLDRWHRRWVEGRLESPLPDRVGVP